MTFPTMLNFLNSHYLLMTAVSYVTLIKDSQTNIHQKVNLELKKVNTWLQANKIKINIEKSKFMIFNYRRQTSVPPLAFGPGQFMETKTITFL